MFTGGCTVHPASNSAVTLTKGRLQQPPLQAEVAFPCRVGLHLLCWAVTMKQAPACQPAVWISLLVAGALIFTAGTPALAQQRVLGIDVSAWQGNISAANWATLKRATNEQVSGIYGDGRDFVLIRSSR